MKKIKLLLVLSMLVFGIVLYFTACKKSDMSNFKSSSFTSDENVTVNLEPILPGLSIVLPPTNQISLEQAQVYYQNYNNSYHQPLPVDAFTVDTKILSAMSKLIYKNGQIDKTVKGFRIYNAAANKDGSGLIFIIVAVNSEGADVIGALYVTDATVDKDHPGSVANGNGPCPFLCDDASQIMKPLTTIVNPRIDENYFGVINVTTAQMLFNSTPHDVITAVAYTFNTLQFTAMAIMLSNNPIIPAFRVYFGSIANPVVAVYRNIDDLSHIYQTSSKGSGLCPFICDRNSPITNGQNKK